MRQFMAKYIHRISPSENDVSGPFTIADSAFANKNTLAKALRKVGILASGERVREMRVEGDKTIVFPGSPPWHSIILTEGAYKAPGVSYPGYPLRTSSLRRVTKRSKLKRKRARRHGARRRLLRRRISLRRRVMSLPKSQHASYHDIHDFCPDCRRYFRVEADRWPVHTTQGHPVGYPLNNGKIEKKCSRSGKAYLP